MAQREQNFIRNYQTAITRLLDALSVLHALRAQYDALGYGDPVTGLQAADVTAAGAQLTLQQLRDGLSSIAALDALLAQGHSTNLYRVADK